MQTYQDRGGDSGVTQFEIGENHIIVQFKDGSQYLYNEIKPGQAHVSEMKRLAQLGSGLNAYINQYVGKNYYQKLK